MRAEEKRPWPPEGAEGEALRELLQKARQVEPWSASERALGWWRIADAAAAPAPGRFKLYALGGVVVAAAALLAVLTLSLRHDAPAAADVNTWAAERVLPSGDVLAVAPGARYAIDSGAVRLTHGSLQATVQPRGEGAFTLATPHVTVTSFGARFLVSAEESSSSIECFEGEVHVRANGEDLTLHSGERILSTDPRLAAPAPQKDGPRPPPPTIVAAPLEIHVAVPRHATSAPRTSCDAEQDRGACLARLASSGGLGAQTALYALALSLESSGDDATSRWREYQTRFPDGVFAPEVSLALMSARASRGENTGAVSEAEAFLRRFSGDPRAAEVRAFRDAIVDAMKLSAGAGQEGP